LQEFLDHCSANAAGRTHDCDTTTNQVLFHGRRLPRANLINL
jgi:hypothetical protein